MRRLLCACGLLLAWLCANGAALDLMQVFAWARMFAGYAHAMPVETALAETFDPAKPCPLCLAVQQARRTAGQQKSVPAPAPAAKLVLIYESPELAVPPPIPGLGFEWLSLEATVRRDPVPVPPPKRDGKILV